MLGNGRTMVADGAMGTMLQQMGVGRDGPCPEAVNISQPEVLKEIASKYLRAGAQIVHTNTFGGSPLKLRNHGLDEQAGEINARAVEAVREAVGDRAILSGSCGPCGRLLEPYGDADPAEVRAGFELQIAALIGAGADAITVETMTDLAEAVLAVEAARNVAPDLPILATMTFDATPRGYFTIMGNTIEQAAAGLKAAGADVVGSNCGSGIEKMIEVAHQFLEASDLPVLIQSNAGLPEIRDGQLIYNETPQFMAEKAGELVNLGVAVIGGCCGTTPDHIRAMRAMVDDRAVRRRD